MLVRDLGSEQFLRLIFTKFPAHVLRIVAPSLRVPDLFTHRIFSFQIDRQRVLARNRKTRDASVEV